LNRFFSLQVIVQPGIPVVYEAGKGSLNQAYIQHCNAVICGTLHSAKIDIPAFILSAEAVDLHRRLVAVSNTYDRVLENYAPSDVMPLQPSAVVH
jgi:hypothetical protein